MYMLYRPCASADSEPVEDAGGGPLSDLVKKVVKGLGARDRPTEEDMRSAWQEAAGPDAAKHSRPVSFKKNDIFVNVDRSSWLYELTVRKKDILKKLGDRLKGRKIKDIRFRIGEIAGDPKVGEKEKTERSA